MAILGRPILPRTWLITADSSRARIFEVLGRDQQLKEIADLVNPEGRANERELKSDANSRIYGHGDRSRSHVSGEPSAVDHATEVFSRELGRYLEKARNDQQYERLYLMAPPRFLGMLRRNLSDEVRKAIVSSIDKDLSWLDSREVEKQLRERQGRRPRA